MKKAVLAEDFGAVNIVKGYEEFFGDLMDIIRSGSMDDTLAGEIQTIAKDFVGNNQLERCGYGDAGYLRSHIGRDSDTGWEAIIMSWRKGDRTAIHSHPEFASYTFGDGEFMVETFEITDTGGLRRTACINISGQQGFYSIGEHGRFDNHIHRITCLSETGHSLHIYSDDALKGYKFDEKSVS